MKKLQFPADYQIFQPYRTTIYLDTTFKTSKTKAENNRLTTIDTLILDNRNNSH